MINIVKHDLGWPPWSTADEKHLRLKDEHISFKINQTSVEANHQTSVDAWDRSLVFSKSWRRAAKQNQGAAQSSQMKHTGS